MGENIKLSLVNLNLIKFDCDIINLAFQELDLCDNILHFSGSFIAHTSEKWDHASFVSHVYHVSYFPLAVSDKTRLIKVFFQYLLRFDSFNRRSDISNTQFL